MPTAPAPAPGVAKALPPINLMKWVEANKHLMKPPVSNKYLYDGEDFFIMIINGPNARNDFHQTNSEEFFYQLKGDMVLKVVDQGRFYDVPIREGDVFLLPPHVPHSPQRPQEGSVGLVVEAARPHALDAFNWYCFGCGSLIHRIEVKVRHLVRDLPPLYEAFYADLDARTCKSCGAIHPGKKPPAGWVRL